MNREAAPGNDERVALDEQRAYVWHAKAAARSMRDFGWQRLDGSGIHEIVREEDPVGNAFRCACASA